jgi:hypothetical protein
MLCPTHEIPDTLNVQGNSFPQAVHVGVYVLALVGIEVSSNGQDDGGGQRQRFAAKATHDGILIGRSSTHRFFAAFRVAPRVRAFAFRFTRSGCSLLPVSRFHSSNV